MMVDRLAEIYFIWREVACCPQVSTSLPHVLTKLGSALEDYFSLVHVLTFCKAELEEEERNTTEKIHGEFFLRKHFAVQPFVGYTPLYPHIYQDTLHHQTLKGLQRATAMWTMHMSF